MSDTRRDIYLPQNADFPPETLESRTGLDAQHPSDAVAELNADVAWHDLTDGLGDRGGVIASSKMRPKLDFSLKSKIAYFAGVGALCVAIVAGNEENIEGRRRHSLRQVKKGATRSHS